MVEDTDIKSLAYLEGLSFEEAKLTYKKREKLPTTAFCGPNRSFPCHDVSNIRESFDKISKEKPEGWEKIVECIKERAKRFKIASSVCEKYGFQESSDMMIDKKIVWYLNKINSEKCEECE